MSAKILFVDIETCPDLVWVWRLYDTNAIAVKEHWKMLSFSAEWFEGEHVTRGLDDYRGYSPKKSDKALVKDLWKLLDTADIVVAHNAASFDIKKINARFILHNLLPPSPYKIVDTLREIRRVAKFSSNKLDHLARQLDIGGKVTHEGFALWQGCMAGDLGAWKRMKKYNRQDVVLLRKLYLRLGPWMKQPNANMWSKKVICINPACRSKRLQWRGTTRNRTRAYRRFQCQACGKWGRSTLMDPENKASVTEV